MTRTWIALVGICALSMPAYAQNTERVWVDVNFGLAIPSDGEFSDITSFPYRSETATFVKDYLLSNGVTFDVGGGYMFLPSLGAGASFARASQSHPATVSASIPSPFYFNLNSTDIFEAQDLQRSENALHLQVLWKFGLGKVDVRVFGGPSWMQVTQDLVTNVLYTETLNFANLTAAINIDSVTVTEMEGSGWGYNVGGDVRYFFNPIVGIGGFVRFTGATVDVPPTTPTVTLTELEGGGFQMGGGLRLKF